MSATGLDVFDKTLQTTHIWLDEVMADVGPDRQVAWHVLGAVLRALRDRVPTPLAAHLGAQLPLIVRGTYYDGYHPNAEPMRLRTKDAFLAHVEHGLHGIRPVDVHDAVCSVFEGLSAHLPRSQCVKVRDALPNDVKSLWQIDKAERSSVEERAAAGRGAQNVADAQAFRTRSSGGGRKRGDG